MYLVNRQNLSGGPSPSTRCLNIQCVLETMFGIKTGKSDLLSLAWRPHSHRPVSAENGVPEQHKFLTVCSNLHANLVLFFGWCLAKLILFFFSFADQALNGSGSNHIESDLNFR